MEIYEHVFARKYSAQHKGGMEQDIPGVLRRIMERISGGQVELTKRLGGKISQPTVSRWLDGAEPKGGNYRRIMDLAREVGAIGDESVTSEDVAVGMDSNTPERTVPIAGFVSAGAEAKFIPLPAGELDRVPAPPGATDLTQCLQVRGDSLGELFDRWLVFYDDVRSPITPDLIGKLCIVGLADERVVVKKIKREGGHYVLVSNTEPPIVGATIVWAAKVTDMRPQ